MLGNYDAPRGNSNFITTVKDFLNRHYNLAITEDNIAVTSGSQTGYFMLFNILAGKSGNTQKKLLFPLVPEYIGYVDQALEPDSFTSLRPKIHKIGDHDFKYGIDFENLKITEDIAGICLSRPTNPTGNVVTDSELEHLSALRELLQHSLVTLLPPAARPAQAQGTSGPLYILPILDGTCEMPFELGIVKCRQHYFSLFFPYNQLELSAS